MKELRELRKELDAAIKPGQAEVVDRLFELLEKQVKRCERLEKENEQLRRRLAELEKQDPPATGSEKTSGLFVMFDALEAKTGRRPTNAVVGVDENNGQWGISKTS